MLSETEIYLKLKSFLLSRSWILLGGQPPGGTNAIPIIEMKDELHKAKGSSGSRKVDLIAYKHPFFLLVELKPSLSRSDISKLREVTSDISWRRAFLRALDEKGVYPKGLSRDKYIENDQFFIRALGFNAGKGKGPDDFVTFLVSDGGIEVHIGRKLTTPIKNLF